jgi:glucarate dehydratase
MRDWTRRRWLASAAGVSGLAGPNELPLLFDSAAAGTRRSGTPAADRPRSHQKISAMRVTIVASPDDALLNSYKVHETHFKRAIVELETADGFTGVSETREGVAPALEAARGVVVGRDPFDIEYLRRNISNVDAFGAVEVACLDIIGKTIDRRVVDLIGGAYRESAPYSAYIFFVMPTPDGPDVSTPEAAARQFADFHRRYGFTSVKFKGGVLHPDKEMEALRLMAAAVPGAKLRIDPNAHWTVPTSLRFAKEAETLGMEYLEDPTRGMDGMAEVRRHTKLPLATNMIVTKMQHVAPAVKKDAVDIILLDLHYMGGLNNTRYWAAICEAVGWGCSGHSNNHLGISMATMTHMNCAISRVAFHADTHYVWTTDDVIKGPRLEFRDGAMTLPDAPGLGVEVDRDKVAALRENVARFRKRDDLLRAWDPSYFHEGGRPPW